LLDPSRIPKPAYKIRGQRTPKKGEKQKERTEKNREKQTKRKKREEERNLG
jgi:hypothetical protein